MTDNVPAPAENAITTDASAQPLLAALDAWRARGGASVDPVRFGVVEALARRATAQRGEARRLLLQRAEALLAQAEAAAPQPALKPAAAKPAALAGLSALIDRLGRSAPLHAPAGRVNNAQRPMAASARGATSPAREASPSPASLRHAAPRPLKAVLAFHGTWSRLRVETRLRQALAQVPPGAGPLNTSHLINRALQAMHELSPAYLDAFMSHIDALQRLEQASGLGEVAARATPAHEAKRRPAARESRKP